MKNQRDAVLGYADEQHAYYIRLIENDAVLGESYGIFCENPESEAAEVVNFVAEIKTDISCNLVVTATASVKFFTCNTDTLSQT